MNKYYIINISLLLAITFKDAAAHHCHDITKNYIPETPKGTWLLAFATPIAGGNGSSSSWFGKYSCGLFNHTYTMYHVVIFTHENTVDVLSNAWVTPKKKRAYWPPEKKVKSCLANHTAPQDDWKLVDIKVKYSTDNLLKAREKCKEACVSSDIESSQDKKRRRILKPKKLSYDSDEFSDEIEVKHSGSIPLFEIEQAQDNEQQDQNQVQIDERDQNQVQIDERDQNQVQIDERDQNQVVENDEQGQYQQVQNDEQVLNILQPSSTPNNEVLDKVAIFLGKMTLQMEDIKIQMTDVQIKLDSLLQIQTKGATSSSRVEIKKCMSTQELLNLENELAVEDTQKNVELHLSLLGGNSPLNKVKRILENILTNNLAQQCNWSGKHNKFPLKDLNKLWKTVYGALRRN